MVECGCVEVGMGVKPQHAQRLTQITAMACAMPATRKASGPIRAPKVPAPMSVGTPIRLTPGDVESGGAFMAEWVGGRYCYGHFVGAGLLKG